MMEEIGDDPVISGGAEADRYSSDAMIVTVARKCASAPLPLSWAPNEDLPTRQRNRSFPSRKNRRCTDSPFCPHMFYPATSRDLRARPGGRHPTTFASA